MRKSTLFLVLPLCWLYAETVHSTESNLTSKKNLVTKNDLTTATWKRGDVIESVKSQNQARIEKEQRLENYTKKLILARDKAYQKDERVHAPDLREQEENIEKKSQQKKPETQKQESKQTEKKKVVELESMTIEMKEMSQKSDTPVEPTITIEVSDKKSEESGSMIIEVKDPAEVPTPQVTMEFVKIKDLKSSVEKAAYPKKFIKVEEEVGHE